MMIRSRAPSTWSSSGHEASAASPTSGGRARRARWASMARCWATVNSQGRTGAGFLVQPVEVPPGPQQRLLHDVLGPVAVAVGQPQGVGQQHGSVLS